MNIINVSLPLSLSYHIIHDILRYISLKVICKLDALLPVLLVLFAGTWYHQTEHHATISRCRFGHNLNLHVTFGKKLMMEEFLN